MTDTTITAGPDPEAESATGRRRRLHPAILPTGLLLLTAVLYIWGLDRNGFANSFYSAAAQAGSQNWEAFFFGSSDAGNSITVDKTPLSLWPMALAIKIFGLSSWTVLLPQALMGVGSVALLWRTVRRVAGDGAGLVAGLVLALTPVAALMFRFNNPDALLVLLMIAAVWAMTRAVEDGRWRWLVLTGVFVGFGFLAKQLQVLLVLPALAGTYLLCGPRRIGTRLLQLLAAGAAMVVSAGWYIATVELWPASSRPWIGGSQNNSLVELTLGYNGLGRLDGNEVGSVHGGPGGAGGGDAMGAAGEAMTTPGGMAAPGGMGGPGGMPPGGPGGHGGGSPFGGQAGFLRLFEGDLGGQIAWLLPAALVALVALLVVTLRRPRTDRLRAAALLWGGWLLVTGLVFSFMQGIMHEYYTVALSPAIAALVGLGTALLWRHRASVVARIVGAVTIAGSAAWAVALLGRAPDFLPWLRWVIVAAAVVAVVALLLSARRRYLAAVAGGAAAIAMLAGPTAYAVETAGTAHTGSIVTAGPRVEGSHGPGGLRGGPGGMPGGAGGPGGMPGSQNGQGTQNGSGARDGSAGRDGRGTIDGTSSRDGRGGAGGGMGGGMGGLLDAATPGAELIALLEQDSDRYTWAAAAIGSQTAAGYQLATELPVMPIGGFNGSDPSPTLEQFKEWVAQGRVHWFIGGQRMGAGDGTSHDTAGDISTWVTETFPSRTVDGVTIYDLSGGTS